MILQVFLTGVKGQPTKGFLPKRAPGPPGIEAREYAKRLVLVDYLCEVHVNLSI
jgi:hypothetical protein